MLDLSILGRYCVLVFAIDIWSTFREGAASWLEICSAKVWYVVFVLVDVGYYGIGAYAELRLKKLFVGPVMCLLLWDCFICFGKS